jgi:hypothetical protein
LKQKLCTIKFKEGDTVELVDRTGLVAPIGATAMVNSVGGDYIYLRWDDPTIGQMDGGYYPDQFRLFFPKLVTGGPTMPGRTVTFGPPNTDVGGLNRDSGKLRMDLVPPSAMKAVAEVLGKATESGKYPERNWEKGIKYSRIYANIQRHLLDWFDGSDKDYESGLNPLKHALCRVAMLIEYIERDMKEFDDRPHTFRKDKK